MLEGISFRDIDINFDFTSDTPRYWDGFWEDDLFFGKFNNDPDSASKTMKLYHKVLYSRILPNGKRMCLKIGTNSEYLVWDDFKFGSDSIIVSFRYKKYRYMIEQVANSMPNWQAYMESYIKKSYTVGGEIIFPKYKGGINQTRGCNQYICDRWDLTLECIRRYYIGETSPLYTVLHKNKSFFDLFIDFRGYVDYFFLQDCVSEDYDSVVFWIGSGEFEKYPFPKTVSEYLDWITKELEFVNKRNNRIREYCQSI